MDEQTLKKYFLSKPETEEDYPFGPDVPVFKVLGKMFGLIGFNKGVMRINLKCDPNEAQQLRDIYDAVIPGYHMNKTHWNTVIIDGSLPDGEIERQIDHSYGLVVKGLKKADRTGLEVRHGKDNIYR